MDHSAPQSLYKHTQMVRRFVGLHGEQQDYCRTIIIVFGPGSLLTHDDYSPKQYQQLYRMTSLSLYLIPWAYNYSGAPLLPEHQNGEILEYRATIVEVETGREMQYNSTRTSMTASPLHPYYSYPVQSGSSYHCRDRAIYYSGGTKN